MVVRVTLPESTFSKRSWSGWPPMSGESGSARLKNLQRSRPWSGLREIPPDRGGLKSCSQRNLVHFTGTKS